MLLARNQGLPLVSVAAIVQEPLTSIVSVDSKHITKPSQLRGKRVGDAGIPYQHAYLETILAQAHVPASSVKEINVGDNLVPAMLSGRVDATLGAFWNYEAIQLAQLHKHPNVIHMQAVGVPDYDELVVVVRKNTIVNHPDVVRRLVQALAPDMRRSAATPERASRTLSTPAPVWIEAPARQRERHAAGVLPEQPRQPLGLAEPQSVERVRPVDADQSPDLGSERRARRVDQRAAGRPGPLTRTARRAPRRNR